MKRLCMLCAIALMGSAMVVAQDQAPQTPRDDNTARTAQYPNQYGTRSRGFDWGWLGLLGLLGLAGRRRSESVNRTEGEHTYIRDARDRAA